MIGNESVLRKHMVLDPKLRRMDNPSTLPLSLLRAIALGLHIVMIIIMTVMVLKVQ